MAQALAEMRKYEEALAGQFLRVPNTGEVKKNHKVCVYWGKEGC